jgi:hypothetical protein
MAKEEKTEESLEDAFQAWGQKQQQRAERQQKAVERRAQKEQQQADGTRPRNGK